jgi:hypothetical protein
MFQDTEVNFKQMLITEVDPLCTAVSRAPTVRVETEAPRSLIAEEDFLLLIELSLCLCTGKANSGKDNYDKQLLHLRADLFDGIRKRHSPGSDIFPCLLSAGF